MANRWVVLAIVFLTRTSMGIQFQSVASVAPLLVGELRLSYAEVGSLIGLYLLPGVFFALPGGWLGQRFGDRPVVVVSLGLMVAGGLVTAGSGSFVPVAAGRLVSGVGAVLMNILLAKMVADWFAGRELATAMAVMLTSWPVGLGAAAASLGALAAGTSWRIAVLATAAVAAVGLLLIGLLYRDPPGSAIAAGAARPIGLSLARRDLKLSASGGLAWGCFNASLVVVVAFGPNFLMTRGLTLGEAGLVVSLAIWVTILSVPLGGLLTDRLGTPNRVIVTGSLGASVVTLLLPAFAQPALGLCLLGLVIGAPPGAIMSLLPKALKPEDLATGLGVFYTVFYLSMAVAQPVAGLVRDLSGSPAAPITFAAALMAATVVGLALFRGVERRPSRV